MNSSKSAAVRESCATPDACATDPAQTLYERLHRFAGGGWILILLLVLVAGFWIARPAQFGSTYNLTMLAVNAAILLVLSVGQTYVIVSAGIDLSVGAVLVFSSVAAAQTMLWLSGEPAGTFGTTSGGWGVIAAGLAVAVASGAAWGALNGALVALVRIPALIVTLGSLGMALGLAQVLTGGVDVRAVPDLLVTQVGNGTLFGIPMLVVIAALVAIVAAVALHLTRFGLQVFAVGSNAEAARRSGIQLRRRIVSVYMLSGMLAGLAAMMSIARFSTTTINGHAMDNLSTISAVVLGGTSLFGGVGTMMGTVIGVFIPIVLLNGFVILGIPPFWQTVAMGAVLIVAVWIDQIKRRVRQG